MNVVGRTDVFLHQSFGGHMGRPLGFGSKVLQVVEDIKL